MSPTIREGGCLCGAVRFRAAREPLSICWCHCTMCRKASGAPAMAWATYRAERVQWSGAPRARYRSSEIGERGFCPRCGGALTFQYTSRPEWLDLALGSFDEAEAMAPTKHVFAKTRLPWMDAGRALPVHRELSQQFE